VTEEPKLGIHRDALGQHAFGRVEYEIRDGTVVYADSGPVGVMVTEANVGPSTEPTLRDLSAALIAVYGTDYGVHVPYGSPASSTQPGRPRPTATGGCCWPATPPTSIPRTVDRGSTSVCRMP